MGLAVGIPEYAELQTRVTGTRQDRVIRCVLRLAMNTVPEVAANTVRSVWYVTHTAKPDMQLNGAQTPLLTGTNHHQTLFTHELLCLFFRIGGGEAEEYPTVSRLADHADSVTAKLQAECLFRVCICVGDKMTRV